MSDIVVRGDMPAGVAGRGAVDRVRGRRARGRQFDLLGKAGFEAVDLEPTRIYTAEDARGFLSQAGEGIDLSSVDGKFMSAFVRARKPRPE